VGEERPERDNREAEESEEQKTFRKVCYARRLGAAEG
jgi:hypothetical protein